MTANKPMNRKEVLEEVVKVTGFTKKDTKTVVVTMLQTIMELVGKGERVTLAGFGAFSVSSRNSRKAMNPYTGEKINVAEKRVPKFTSSTNFKRKVNKKSMSDKEKEEIASHMRKFLKK
jgi:DNA-binding protein HU-beta